jgi:hypothetical protein
MAASQRSSASQHVLAVPEILRNILVHLDRSSNLYSCIQVSKLWNAEAISLLWHGLAPEIWQMDNRHLQYTPRLQSQFESPSSCWLRRIDRPQLQWYLPLIQNFLLDSGNVEKFHREFLHQNAFICLQSLIEDGSLGNLSPRVIDFHPRYGLGLSCHDVMLQLLSTRLRYISMIKLGVPASILRMLPKQCPKLRFIALDERWSLDAGLWLDILPIIPSLTHLLFSNIEDSEEEIDLLVHLSQRPNLEMLSLEYKRSSPRREARLRDAFMNRDELFSAL